MRERWALLESPALGEGKTKVRTLDGVDELNRLFRFEIVVGRHGVMSPLDDVAPLLDTPATLWLEEDGATLGAYHGIIAEASLDVDVESELSILHVTLVPRAWLLTQRRGDEIFLGKTIPEIVAEKLERIGLVRDRDFALSLLDRYPVREYVAQHEETDWAFVSRLCEHLGITVLFEQRDGRDVLVLSDTPSTFRPIARPKLPVRHRRHHPAAYSVKTKLRRLPSRALARDYNYRTPLVHLHEQHALSAPGVAGEWFDYGGHSKTTEETARIARIRKEEMGAQQHVVSGVATELSVRAGGTFVLMGVGPDQELLLTKVTFRYRRSEGGSAESMWENEFQAIPVNVPFRPERATPRPHISGLKNAVVDGIVKGDYAELDEAGRYRLRMLYDRSGRTDLGATHPVRMMQPHAGASYGMHFPLRPGVEVLVAFVNGDPDRPIIVGTAPNPLTASPVLQQNQTQNVLRTGSDNEMVIEDERGSERVRIHTPKANTTIQLGAVEEPEEGALTRTDAHISEASRLSNNEATTTKTLLADTVTTLAGRSAVVAAGIPSLTAACERGIDQPSSVSLGGLGRDLSMLSRRPEALANRQVDEDARDGGASVSDPSAGRLWSSIGAGATEAGSQAAMDLVRAVGSTTDDMLDQSIGRAQGEPIGDALEPAAVVAADRTAALLARDLALVFGDRAAAVSSYDTASVVGREVAQLKAPALVEIAAGRDAKLTSAGTLDVQANLVRLVGGYYPEAEAPALDEGTSVGVMSRQDLRFMSVEDCILACAKKCVVMTSHTSDIRMHAKKSVSMTAGSIVGSAGTVSSSSSGDTSVIADADITISAGGNLTVEAGGDAVLTGATVTIKGGTITLEGPVTINGDLTVNGAINGG